MPVTPQDEARIRADERNRVRSEAIDGQLGEIFKRLAKANSLSEVMITKADFRAFEQRHEERLQEFMHQARNIFVEKHEVEKKRQATGEWHQLVWVRIGIAAGIVVGLVTIGQAIVLVYLGTVGKHP